MLNSCGQALSQGDGSDFHPRCNWEATSPGHRACVRAWRRLAPCHGATPAQTYYDSQERLEKYGNASRYNIVGGLGNGAAEEGWRWDLNPGVAAMPGRKPHIGLRKQEKLCREEKGRKDSCWWAVRRCHLALD